MSETATSQDERTRAAIAYILTWITGLIIFFTAKKEDKYARWHAIQAIALGIAFVVVGFVLNIFFTMMALGGGAFGMGGMFGLSSLLWLAAIVIVVILAVKAYQGDTVRIPVLADFADKYA